MMTADQDPEDDDPPAPKLFPGYAGLALRRGNTNWTVTPSNMLPDIHSRFTFFREDSTEHPWDLAYIVWHTELPGYSNTIALVFGVADVLYHLDASPARHDLVAIKDQINWRELWMPFSDVPDYLTYVGFTTPLKPLYRQVKMSWDVDWYVKRLLLDVPDDVHITCKEGFSYDIWSPSYEHFVKRSLLPGITTGVNDDIHSAQRELERR